MNALLTEILRAERRIRPHILKTPLIPSLPLRELSGADVWLKMESEQYTNSFKVRGATNKVLWLSEAERRRGVVTASTGNHAQGVAYALRLTGGAGTIFLPAQAEPSKVEAIRRYPVELVFVEGDALATELHARRTAAERGKVWISPYNDPQIIGGQGTIAVELTEQTGPVDDVLVTVGGGGLISGMAVYLKAVAPGVRVIGCLPERSPDMYRSVQAGRILSLAQHDTLSDGSAGGIEPGSITFPVCRTLVDDYILVPEEEIRAALRLMVDAHHKIVEGAAAVAVAAFLRQRERFRDRRVVIVVCGANIATEKLRAVLETPAGR
jgi:threonine dehydratase